MAIITTIKDRINQLNQASFQILCDALLARELYQIITGPKWDLDISYDERKKRKEDNVRAYMVDATDKIATFRDMLKLLIESNAIKDSDSYEIADGINIALQSLSDNREAYITCAKMILASEVTTGIGIMI